MKVSANGNVYETVPLSTFKKRILPNAILSKLFSETLADGTELKVYNLPGELVEYIQHGKTIYKVPVSKYGSFVADMEAAANEKAQIKKFGKKLDFPKIYLEYDEEQLTREAYEKTVKKITSLLPYKYYYGSAN